MKRGTIRKIIAGFITFSWVSVSAGSGDPLFPQLEKVGEKYSFAILADPQVHTEEFAQAIFQTTQLRLSETVDEINQMDPQPAFVVVNGDLVTHTTPQRGGDQQMENFIKRVLPLEMPTILTHGNHDGRTPWDQFKKMQKAVNGTEAVMFSWDAGQWHFIAVPAYVDTEESKKNLYKWLEKDLEKNKDRPTMFFVHWHLMPGYQTNHEWYTFDKPVRNRVLELLTEHGNVRHAFFGHVHNGIMTAVKSTWEYKGIKCVTVPTIIAPRCFGEEYPEFAEALGEAVNEGDTGGGYYVMVDVDGEDVSVRCKLVNNKNEYVITDYKPYQDDEPLWFKNAAELPANKKLVNGSFENGLDGWQMPLRYLRDVDPGYVVDISPNPKGKGNGAVVQVRETGQRWASDETMEVYQVVRVPSKNPVFEASYMVEKPTDSGGGYIRLCLYSGTDLKFLILFDWTDADKVPTQRFSQHAGWMATGKKDDCMPNFLLYKGMDREAAFWSTSTELGKWHKVQIDITSMYDILMEKYGAYSGLDIDRMVVGAGAWSFGSRPGMLSRVRFDNLKLSSASRPMKNPVLFNGDPLTVNAQAFHTDHGQRYNRRKAAAAAPAQISYNPAPQIQKSSSAKAATPAKTTTSTNEKKEMTEEERAIKRARAALVSPEEKAEKRKRKEARLQDQQGG